MWGLPRSGVKLMSPALAGGFFTTEPLGKPQPSWILGCIVNFSDKKYLSSFPTAGLSMPGHGLFMASVAQAPFLFLESVGGVGYICTATALPLYLRFFFSFCSFSHS